MYTLEEIEEKANAQAKKMFWTWFLTFGIGFPIGLPLIMVPFGTDVDLSIEAIGGYLKSVIFTAFLLAALSGAVMSAVAYYNTKKKLKEENEHIKVISVAPLFGEVIRRVYHDESVNSLFDIK